MSSPSCQVSKEDEKVETGFETAQVVPEPTKVAIAALPGHLPNASPLLTPPLPDDEIGDSSSLSLQSFVPRRSNLSFDVVPVLSLSQDSRQVAIGMEERHSSCITPLFPPLPVSSSTLDWSSTRVAPW